MKKSVYSLVLISCMNSCAPASGTYKLHALHKSGLTLFPKSKQDQTTFSCSIVKQHLFSDKNHSDVFKLLYDCKDVEGPMILQIVTASGHLIYEQQFKGSDFYDYSRPWYVYVTDPQLGKDFNPDNLSKRIKDSLQKEDLKYLDQKMKELFSDDRFEVDPLKHSTSNLIDESELTEFKNDPALIGFSYTIGSVEGFETIAYSKRKKKVVTVISSD